MEHTRTITAEHLTYDPEAPQAIGRKGRNVGRAERWASVAAGTGLVLLGLRTKAYRKPLMAAGGGLVSRGVTGWCPVNASIGRNSAWSDTTTALGGSRGVRVEESVTIDAPVQHIYAFWRKLENLPRFMRHLESVRSGPGRQSHWVARGPAGISVEWDAIVINEIENELIAWRTLEGAEVVSAGSVAFESLRDRTCVTVTLQYDPPAGKMGAFISRLFGEDPSRQIRSDLQRLKKYFEGSQFWLPGPEKAYSKA